MFTILRAVEMHDARKYILTTIADKYFFDSCNFGGTFFGRPKRYTGLQNAPAMALPPCNSVYDYHNVKGIKFVIRLRLALNNLHKFKHSCKDSLNLTCNCGCAVKSISQFLTTIPHVHN